MKKTSNISYDIKLLAKRRLKEVREFLGLDQEPFGVIVKIPQSNLSNIENVDHERGVPERVILLLEKLYNINPEFFTNKDLKMPVKKTPEINYQVNDGKKVAKNQYIPLKGEPKEVPYSTDRKESIDNKMTRYLELRAEADRLLLEILKEMKTNQ